MNIKIKSKHVMTLEDGDALYWAVHYPLLIGRDVTLDFTDVQVLLPVALMRFYERLHADAGMLDTIDTQLAIVTPSELHAKLIARCATLVREQAYQKAL